MKFLMFAVNNEVVYWNKKYKNKSGRNTIIISHIFITKDFWRLTIIEKIWGYL